MYNATKTESGKGVQIFCSVAHEIMCPNQIGWYHQVTHGGERCLINMSSGSGKSICYALLPWAFDLLCNQFDWGTQFRVPQNKNVKLSSQTLDYTLCDNAYINESGNETTISIPYRNMCTLCEVLMSEITVSFYAL